MLLPNYTALWQSHMAVNNLPTLVMEPRTEEGRTRDLLIASPTPYSCAITPPIAILDIP